MFVVHGPCGVDLKLMVSDGTDWPFDAPAWEHVSVSTRSRTPNWREMEYVRSLCWADDELVLQFSVPRQKHINLHPYCLHLWRPIGVDIPLPPPETVGPAEDERRISQAIEEGRVW
jgi:hypothetical protein